LTAAGAAVQGRRRLQFAAQIGSSTAASRRSGVRLRGPDSRSGARLHDRVPAFGNAKMEANMTMISIVETASRDAYPALLKGLEAQFGREDSVSIAAHFLSAELADFHWESRISERRLGAFESADEDEIDLDRIAIVGQLKGSWFVATCLVDGEGAVHDLQSLALKRNCEEAQIAFDALQ